MAAAHLGRFALGGNSKNAFETRRDGITRDMDSIAGNIEVRQAAAAPGRNLMARRQQAAQPGPRTSCALWRGGGSFKPCTHEAAERGALVVRDRGYAASPD